MFHVREMVYIDPYPMQTNEAINVDQSAMMSDAFSQKVRITNGNEPTNFRPKESSSYHLKPAAFNHRWAFLLYDLGGLSSYLEKLKRNCFEFSIPERITGCLLEPLVIQNTFYLTTAPTKTIYTVILSCIALPFPNTWLSTINDF